MKAVLASIQPKWCELIASGKKTVEVRKTKPNIPTPFKCYIYYTKGKERLIEVIKDGDEIYGDVYHGKPVFTKTPEFGIAFGNSGKVMGEFVCDKIVDFSIKNGEFICLEDTQGYYTCITLKQATDYIGESGGYFWHISDLVIYDKPKELSEFGLSRPPQSWCYVEEDKAI